MTTDAHVHVWQRAVDPQPWIDPDTMAAIDRDFTLDDLVVALDAVHVRSAVIVQSSNSLAETRRLLAAATACDRVAGVVGWLDLTADLSEQIDSIPDRDRALLVGVRHLAHIDPDPAWLSRPDVQRGLSVLGQADLTFDLVLRWPQIPMAVDIAGALPGVHFVLDHLGNPPLATPEMTLWERSLRSLAALPNTSAKVSGIAGALGKVDWTGDMCRAAIEVALDAYGPERLMYGSDWPVVELVGGPTRWHEAITEVVADLHGAERDALFGGTASQVYGLGRR